MKRFIAIVAVIAAIAVIVNFTVFKDMPEEAALKEKILSVEQLFEAVEIDLYEANVISARLLFLMDENNVPLYCANLQMKEVEVCLTYSQSMLLYNNNASVRGLINYPVRGTATTNDNYWAIFAEEAEKNPNALFKDRYPELLKDAQSKRKLAMEKAKELAMEIDYLEEELTALQN